jgi:membrane-associated phospholipid phosphatase
MLIKSRTIRVGLALALAARSVAAQDAIPQKQPDSSTVRANKKLFTHRDVVMAGAFTATTLILIPLDRQFANELQDPSVQANKFLKDASYGVAYIASPGAYYIGGGLYLVGRVAKKPRVADLGWHGTEAVLLGEGVSMLLKGTLGRARPFVSIDQPRDFKFGRGFGKAQWRSFPSGHATTAFAAAAAVTDETTLWWPKSTWIVGPVMYGGATMVALSRMYNNRHWGSDVAVGALIGTFSGKKVVLASHANPGNVIDRLMLGGFIAPSEFGTVKVGWAAKW